MVFNVGIKPAGGLRFDLTGNLAGAIDYMNSRSARAVRILPEAEFAIGPHINFNLSHSFERLDNEGQWIYTANILQGRAIYNFNTRCFLRLIVQYRNVQRDPAMYGVPVDAGSNSLFTQFLFSYKLNPQTVLFLGYSDNGLGNQDLDLTRTDRTFFLKIGYALVL